MFQVNTWMGLLVASGMVLGAAYMLWLYRKVIFGALEKDGLKKMLDMNKREMAVFAPLVIITLWLGVYPLPLFDVMSASVENLIQNYETAIAAAGSEGFSFAGLLDFK